MKHHREPRVPPHSSQPRVVSWLTATSFLASAALFGPPVVIAAVPFWSEEFLNRSFVQLAGPLLVSALVISVIGFATGILAVVLARRASSPTGSAWVAVGLNAIPLLWCIGGIWLLQPTA